MFTVLTVGEKQLRVQQELKKLSNYIFLKSLKNMK